MFRHALAVMRKVHGDLWHTYNITAGLGQFLNSRHRYEEAEALLQDAISRLDSLPGAPPDMAARLAGELDAVYRSWGKPERAAEWERKRPADTEAALTRKARLLAVEESSQAIKLQPDRWEAWNGRASAYFHLQQWEPAITDFSRAIELAPQVHTNWFHRGHAYLQLAQWDKAAADFTKVIEGWPDAPEGWYLRALAYAQLSQPEKAITDLRQAIARGFTDVERVKNDPKLDPLHSNEEYKKLLAAMEAKQK
jgi:tetratricopeptide (TPR) repeat protein